ncbi:MAG: hypothetical protein II346_01785, partial [Ruminococcus sp.]|nr:hypothetical protein [Ruminococcus sp.]
AMLESLRQSVPKKLRATIIDNLFERAKTALISVDALQNEVLRLMQENERLSAKVAELEAKLG